MKKYILCLIMALMVCSPALADDFYAINSPDYYAGIKFVPFRGGCSDGPDIECGVALIYIERQDQSFSYTYTRQKDSVIYTVPLVGTFFKDGTQRLYYYQDLMGEPFIKQGEASK